MKKRESIRYAVTALTAALIGSSAARAADQDQVESSLLIYSEKDRVQAAEGIVGITKHLRGEYLLGLHFTFDGLTGPSPNGAAPSSKIQTFTRPSGNGFYSVQPGKIPLDDTFKDTRLAADASLAKPLGRMTQASAGIHLSAEHDYSSIGFNAGLTQDFFQRNTTLGLSGAYSRDAVKPVGGALPAYSQVLPPSNNGGEHEGENEGEGGASYPKDVIDAVVSINQVVTRSTIVRTNYSYSRSKGFLRDPYKILSVIQDANSANPGQADTYIYEKRPDSRTKQAIYAEVRQYLGGHAMDFSYRYFWDDWGVTSRTADFFFTWQFKNGHTFQPHVRWYNQSAADFHRYFLVQNEPLPENASADSRLAKFEALTVGAEYSLPVNTALRLRFTGEYYTQMGDSSPPEAFGELRQFDLFPKLQAFMFRIGFVRDF